MLDLWLIAGKIKKKIMVLTMKWCHIIHSCGRLISNLWLNGFFFNSLWPSDTTWRHRTGSTLAQVMACCLMAPSHYLNQCWFIIGEVHWATFIWCWFQLRYLSYQSLKLAWKLLSEVLLKSPRGQWVKKKNMLMRPMMSVCPDFINKQKLTEVWTKWLPFL